MDLPAQTHWPHEQYPDSQFQFQGPGQVSGDPPSHPPADGSNTSLSALINGHNTFPAYTFPAYTHDDQEPKWSERPTTSIRAERKTPLRLSTRPSLFESENYARTPMNFLNEEPSTFEDIIPRPSTALNTVHKQPYSTAVLDWDYPPETKPYIGILSYTPDFDRYQPGPAEALSKNSGTYGTSSGDQIVAQNPFRINRKKYAGYSTQSGSRDVLDLTEKVTKRSQNAAHGGSYADIFIGDYEPWPGSNQKVAIKVLRMHILSKEHKGKIHKRVSREIRLWAPLNHPNVLPLIGTVRNMGSELAMVSPWMDDGNLSEYLDANRQILDAGRRTRICEEIVNGLRYIHGQHVIHGDLTTANIFMHHGVAMLGDFGLSNVIAELQGASFVISKVGGSSRWAAPELFLIDDSTPVLTFHADIYSLGNVMLHILSGEVPYSGLTEYQVMGRLLNKSKPPRPYELPFLTDEYWELINQCLKTDAAARPSADEIWQMWGVKLGKSEGKRGKLSTQKWGWW